MVDLLLGCSKEIIQLFSPPIFPCFSAEFPPGTTRLSTPNVGGTHFFIIPFIMPFIIPFIILFTASAPVSHQEHRPEQLGVSGLSQRRRKSLPHFLPTPLEVTPTLFPHRSRWKTCQNFLPGNLISTELPSAPKHQIKSLHLFRLQQNIYQILSINYHCKLGQNWL